MPSDCYLTAGFEGRFMCRLATDPDPNNEPRGRSGYTMALTTEAELDQVIRLQTDPYVEQHMRAPSQQLGFQVGVNVRWVTIDGDRVGAHPLLGARVSLQGTNDIFPGPTFESRNNIVGSDDTLAFVVNPFELTIAGPGVALRAVDHLNPDAPEEEIWQIKDPASYGRRFPATFDASSPEVMQAIGVFDGYAYFRGRRAYLTEEIDRLKGVIDDAGGHDDEAELLLQQAVSRHYQLEFWGDRVINKLGFRLEWAFDINGPTSLELDDVAAAAFGGTLAHDRPWRVTYWFGGWDGDLLLGYMRGRIDIPLEPTPELRG